MNFNCTKKFFMAVFICITVLSTATSTSFAGGFFSDLENAWNDANTDTSLSTRFPRSDMAIGGISLGGSIQYVEQIYGAPTKSYIDLDMSDYSHGKTVAYNYNDKFIVYAGNSGQHIDSIICRESGLSMPGGIAVGMKYSIVKKIYGGGRHLEDDFIVQKIDKTNSYAYNAGTWNLQFSVDSEGIIRQIVIYSGV